MKITAMVKHPAKIAIALTIGLAVTRSAVVRFRHKRIPLLKINLVNLRKVRQLSLKSVL